MKQAHKARNLSRGWCAWCSLGKDRACGRISIFRQRQRSDRLENGDTLGSLDLVGSLVPQMTVRATRVLSGIVMIPVADDAGGKNQQRDQREGNPDYANRLLHGNSGNPG